MTTETILVRLLIEGTDTWYRVPAEKLTADRYRLLVPDNYDPEDLELEFLPGEIIIVSLQRTPGGRVALTAIRAA